MATVYCTAAGTAEPTTQSQNWPICNVTEHPITTANIHCIGTDSLPGSCELQICHLQPTRSEPLTNRQTKLNPTNLDRELDWTDCLMTDSGASLYVCPTDYCLDYPLDTECPRPDLYTAAGDGLMVTGKITVQYELGNKMELQVSYWVCNVKGPLVLSGHW